MAKRRTRQQIDSDKIIREYLMDLGEKVYDYARTASRVAETQYFKTDRVEPKGSIRKEGGTLRDSVNFMPISDTVLLLVQVDYGKYQDPNELQVGIDKYLDDTIDFIVTDITKQIVQDYDS